MSRPLKKPSLAPTTRRMAKANLRSQKLLRHTTLARDAAGEAGSTVAEIIETYHDTKAKTIRGKKSS